MNDLRLDLKNSDSVEEKHASSMLQSSCLQTSLQPSPTPDLQPLNSLSSCQTPGPSSPSTNHQTMIDNNIDAKKRTPAGNPRKSPQGSPRKSPEQLKAVDISRSWENTTSNKHITSNKQGLAFTVLNYNILAQTLLENHSYLYEKCDSDNLKWAIRFKRITDEIAVINPDIVCLQEVQDIHLDQISRHLDKLGLMGIFKQKTGTRQDGCAIYFRKAMFQLIHCESVEFFQPDIYLLNRDNIGLMMKLKPLSWPDSPFVVCTTHLLFNPRRSDVRLAQMQVFLAEIDRFSFHKKDNSPTATHLPIILAGDFNSHPDSPVTQLVADGNYVLDQFPSNLLPIQVTSSCQHLGVYLERNNRRRFSEFKSSMLYHSETQKSYQVNFINIERAAKDYAHLFHNAFVRHNLNFQSVYDHKKDNGEWEATSYQNAWTTVDYIYYSPGSSNSLGVLQRFRLPTVEECTGMGALPNSQFGSDHLSLAAKFILLSSPPNSPEVEVSNDSIKE